jgi:hypothetical protein
VRRSVPCLLSDVPGMPGTTLAEQQAMGMPHDARVPDFDEDYPTPTHTPKRRQHK